MLTNMLKRKIHFGYALFIIAALSVIPVSLYVGLLISPDPAEAVIGFDVGLRVISPPIKCVLNSIEGNCLASCPICGDTAVCNGLFEVKAQFLSGTNLLYKGAALCIPSPVTPLGGAFRPGAQCLGKYFAVGPVHTLFNFNCGR